MALTARFLSIFFVFVQIADAGVYRRESQHFGATDLLDPGFEHGVIGSEGGQQSMKTSYKYKSVGGGGGSFLGSGSGGSYMGSGSESGFEIETGGESMGKNFQVEGSGESSGGYSMVGFNGGKKVVKSQLMNGGEVDMMSGKSFQMEGKNLGYYKQDVDMNSNIVGSEFGTSGGKRLLGGVAIDGGITGSGSTYQKHKTVQIGSKSGNFDDHLEYAPVVKLGKQTIQLSGGSKYADLDVSGVLDQNELQRIVQDCIESKVRALVNRKLDRGSGNLINVDVGNTFIKTRQTNDGGKFVQTRYGDIDGEVVSVNKKVVKTFPARVFTGGVQTKIVGLDSDATTDGGYSRTVQSKFVKSNIGDEQMNVGLVNSGRKIYTTGMRFDDGSETNVQGKVVDLQLKPYTETKTMKYDVDKKFTNPIVKVTKFETGSSPVEVEKIITKKVIIDKQPIEKNYRISGLVDADDSLTGQSVRETTITRGGSNRISDGNIRIEAGELVGSDYEIKNKKVFTEPDLVNHNSVTYEVKGKKLYDGGLTQNYDQASDNRVINIGDGYVSGIGSGQKTYETVYETISRKVNPVVSVKGDSIRAGQLYETSYDNKVRPVVTVKGDTVSIQTKSSGPKSILSGYEVEGGATGGVTYRNGQLSGNRVINVGGDHVSDLGTGHKTYETSYETISRKVNPVVAVKGGSLSFQTQSGGSNSVSSGYEVKGKRMFGGGSGYSNDLLSGNQVINVGEDHVADLGTGHRTYETSYETVSRKVSPVVTVKGNDVSIQSGGVNSALGGYEVRSKSGGGSFSYGNGQMSGNRVISVGEGHVADLGGGHKTYETSYETISRKGSPVVKVKGDSISIENGSGGSSFHA